MFARFTRFLLPATFLWALVIFILCTLPGEELPNPPPNIPHLDKIVHWGMFLILSLLLMLSAESKTTCSKTTLYLLVISVSFLYGGLIEILQHYFFQRSGDIWDLTADVLGSITACCCYPFIKHLFFKF